MSGQSTTDNVGPKRRTLDSFMGQENKQSEKKDEKILIVVGCVPIFLPQKNVLSIFDGDFDNAGLIQSAKNAS